MLEGIDEIDWASHEGAYGPAVEAPDILRAMASPDSETAEEGRDEFYSSLWHQGSVYPATVAAVPFLVELANAPGVHERAQLIHTIGALCDPAHSYGDEGPAVRAAVAARSDSLVPSLADPDPEVRECAAYAVAHCGPHTAHALRERWEAERDPQVRASLLLGLALHDPDAELLRSAALSEEFPVPAAAALALVRAELPFPAEIIPSVAAAFAGPEEWRTSWQEDAALSEVLERLDGTTADALLAALAGPASAGRIRAAGALVTRFHARRSAPVAAMPLLRELVNDADAEVRAAAVDALAHAGRPAAALADDLARLAAADDERIADQALATLVRLDDPRWHDLVRATWAAGHDPGVLHLLRDRPPVFDTDLLAALRRRLAAQLAEGLTGNPVIALVGVLGHWGPAAADALPELEAALPVAPWAVPLALAKMGPAALPALPALHEDARAGSVRAAHAIWRLSHDPEPLVTVASDPGFWSKGGLDWDLNLVADAGPAAARLVPQARTLLTGTAAEIYPERQAQISAARLVWLATGDPGPVLPTVAAVLDAGDFPARTAAKLAAEMGTAAGTDLIPALRRTLDNEWARVEAACALSKLGTDQDGLVGPLLTSVSGGSTRQSVDAVAALVEMRAREVVPVFEELAQRDERLFASGSYDEIVWDDDRMRETLRQAAAELAA